MSLSTDLMQVFFHLAGDEENQGLVEQALDNHLRGDRVYVNPDMFRKQCALPSKDKCVAFVGLGDTTETGELTDLDDQVINCCLPDGANNTRDQYAVTEFVIFLKFADPCLNTSNSPEYQIKQMEIEGKLLDVLETVSDFGLPEVVIGWQLGELNRGDQLLEGGGAQGSRQAICRIHEITLEVRTLFTRSTPCR